jgi:hypothetical protein
MWRAVFTKQAQKDAKKLTAAGLQSKKVKQKHIIGNYYDTGYV